MNGSASAEDSQDLPDLVARIARGDEQALARLYDLTSRTVYGLVLWIVRDPSAAEEAALEVYMQVWRTAAHYSRERGSVTAWLATVARSRALDWLRSGQARQFRAGIGLENAPEPVSTVGLPDAQLIQNSRAAMVRRALEALPAEQRRVIEMGFYGGLSHAEIAETLGAPLGTVKSRMRMAVRKVRELLAPYMELA